MTGRTPNAAELAEYDALTQALRPDASLKRLDDYAKWIFTSASTVGVLAAAFSTEAFKTLTETGRVMLAIAVALLGASLIFAAWSAAPKWRTYNPFSSESMRGAIRSTYDERKLRLTWAGTCFGLALLLAAAIPLANIVLNPPNAIARTSYALGSDRSITASTSAELLRDGDIASLHVSLGGGVVASAQTVSGPTGSVTLETTVKDAAPGQYVIAVTRTSKDGTETRIGTDVFVTVP